ncbi:Lrp/AsnC family transcriptional regulator [Pseudonocardia acaciae]|uniref:Lrp/AsnC family transcriptional regulator n=1 Tax=Pseudonocardia acaciae TaxID=551276 RepID=UPI000B01637E|nr:Lrp/AsnC family transcriptional regulator [Pseudonocardia acaciae]
MRHLDQTDARIVLALDDDPLATTVAVAARLNLARNTVQARHRRIEADGSLAPTSVRVRPGPLGYPVLAFITLAISQTRSEDTLAEITAVPEVCEIHAVTGDADLLVRVVAKDNKDLYRVTGLLLGCSGVVRSNTLISMVEVVPLRMAQLLRVAQ